MKPVIYVAENLFLRDDVILSYDTEVAHIEDGAIHEHGRYSRTTTRQISKIASFLKIYKVIHSSEVKMTQWNRYDYGVRCKHDFTLSTRASAIALTAMSEGKTYLTALCLVLESKIQDRDRQIITNYLNTHVKSDALSVARSVARISTKFI